jgi:hypothetical protein
MLKSLKPCGLGERIRPEMAQTVALENASCLLEILVAGLIDTRLGGSM